MALFSDLPKELALIILLMDHDIDVDRNGNKITFQCVDNALIGESGRTARDTVVSDTAQWITVHGPDEHRLFLCR